MNMMIAFFLLLTFFAAGELITSLDTLLDISEMKQQ